MTPGSNHPDDVTDTVTETIGSSADAEASDLDEDCSPNRVCRNARAFSFDGFAEEGGDVQAAWRETLAREGKLDPSGESIRDLVLGPPTSS
jgi:hypothetical protein